MAIHLLANYYHAIVQSDSIFSDAKLTMLISDYITQSCFSYSEFMTYHRSKKNKTYIIKPDNSCQGKGIMLTKTPKVGILRGDIVACVGARDGRATNNR